MKDHKGCYCLYKGCNGAVISRSQRKEHKAKDKIACVRASLGLSATQRGRVTDAPRAFPRPSSPMSLNQPFSASSPPQQPYTPDQSKLASNLNASPCHRHVPSHVRYTELRELTEAEERGEAYTARMEAEIPMDNIGELDEDTLDNDLNIISADGESRMNQDDLPRPLNAHASRTDGIPPAQDTLPLRVVPDADPRYR
jgi:hypothetical protein